MSRGLPYLMFFLSGAGALVFENIWFSQTGMIVGNSVWAAALVVGAFMAGLALGNAAAVLLARRWTNLLRAYACLEIVAGVSGAALVAVYPHLPALFAPMLSPFMEHGAALNALRAAIAFLLMVAPAAALGTTLPLLCRPLEQASGSYGVTLGRLYGVNTLGAVAGALVAELVLIPAVGLRGSGLAAAACNLTASAIAFGLARDPIYETRGGVTQRVFVRGQGGLLLAAFLAGGILLALEVVWFRYLLLFFTGTTLVFAVMLAVVLAGIGAGGLIAAGWSRRWSAQSAARLAAALAAAGVVAGYAGFDAFSAYVAGAGVLANWPLAPVTLLAVFLMGPVSVLSGVLFTALGELVRGRSGDAVDATAALALANTLGAMLGSLGAVFFLLPGRGIEGSFFILAALYAVLALALPGANIRRLSRFAPALLAAAALPFFPFGRMVERHHQRVEEHFGARLVAAREGIGETAFYLAHGFLGELLYHRLVTNTYSMSATTVLSQRYMKLFAYLPAALHPRIERALLICFGVGVTAQALTELPDARAIDVVDVSRDILEMSDIAHPDPARHPLKDPRVAVHVEDGRFFLQHTARRYDLITGEPPPPKIAGVAALYSREYFELVRARLNPEGLATYWLPVHQLRIEDVLAITRAFCDAFPDCSLWSGVGLDWLLLGSRDGIRPVSREHFSRPWRWPATHRGLLALGLDTPEHMVAQFMADAAELRRATALVEPVTDDFPRRISAALPSGRIGPILVSLMHAGRSRARLEGSGWAADILPQPLREAAAPHFRERAMLDLSWYPDLRPAQYNPWSDLAELLRRTDQTTVLRWMLGSELRKAEIATQLAAAGHAQNPSVTEQLVIDALVTRRAPLVLTRERFLAMPPSGQAVAAFHRCLRGDNSLLDWVAAERRGEEPYRSFFAWAAANCAASAPARAAR